ncbi:MAG TPA: hypothetical protein VHL14_12700 [Steroidobacteraceae bacterium]|nr:hypothetical protein [Steroidobacteraceae bacterium]
MNKAIQIYASGDHYHQVQETLPDLKELTQQVTGKSFRRIGRFIQLAMIGAARCTQLSVPKNTAVYLSSGRGDLELTVEIMTELFLRSQTPKPLAFVNTVSNAACFYVAQLLGLKSRSNYVCNLHFAFESVLQLAATDLLLGNTTSALVGSIDVVTQPVNDHRQRLKLASDTTVGEGSHWLWLGTSDISKPRLGDLIAAEHFNEKEPLIEWIRQQSPEKLALSFGQHVNTTDQGILRSLITHEQVFDYRVNRAYYDCHSGAAIGEFLRSDCLAQTLLHINADRDGRYSVMLVNR